MQSHKIVVCGAAGNQGGAVAAALLENGRFSVAALTRDPDRSAARSLTGRGAEILKADLAGVGSLMDAFSGAYGVFAVTQPWDFGRGKFDRDAELRQLKNIIWAAKEAGVTKVVFSSVLNLRGLMSDVSWIDNKLLLEKLLFTYIPDSVIIRPALYMDHLGDELLKITGHSIKGRFGSEALVPYVALSDIGSSVAAIFEDYEAYQGKAINLVGDLVSGREIAGMIAELSGDDSFHYRSVNETYLRLFSPSFFRMRKFFELQGSLLEFAQDRKTGQFGLLNEGLSMKQYLARHIGRLNT